MKTAYYQQNKLHLSTYNREKLQLLYDEGKKGLLTCTVCNDPVRLYLGINGEPSFYHHLNHKPDCPESISVQTNIEQDDQNFIERNGFKIPTSRSIGTAALTQPMVYKKAHRINNLSPFVAPNLNQSVPHGGYLQKLASRNIFLDSQQCKAVVETEGPLLVLAGAGSGKTRVLTSRTAYLLAKKQVNPQSIMLVTFTAKAAGEMKARLLTYPEIDRTQVQRLVSGTFHSIFYRILTFHQPNIWTTDKLLKHKWQQEKLLKEAGMELQLEEKEFAYDLALQQIGFWKNSLLMPHEIKPESPWEEKTNYLYKSYEQHKAKHQLFDFDDMLIGCYQMLLKDPDILKIYQNRFQYVMIDEFQDINRVQYELIKLLSVKTNNLCAVGDDDQSIYSFRGSDPAFLTEFKTDFPNFKKVVLDQNYRSTHEIVEFANEIITDNKQRFPKEMLAQASKNQFPVVFFPYDEEEEATMIVTDLLEKISNGANPSDFAILFRTNTSSRAIFERLANSSLPFTIDQDIDSFYDRFMIKSTLSCLKLSLDEDSQTAISTISPLLFLKQSALRDIKAESILRDCTMLEAMSNLKTGYAFQERKLKKLLPVIRSFISLPPLIAIEIAEKELGLADFLKKRGNDANKFDKGSDDIRDLKVAAKNFKSIREFIEHTEHMSAMNKEIKRTSKTQTNSITLSTIHRAKGLEYKIVYLLSTVDGSLPHDHALDSLRNGDSSQLEEERRLLYVATTRAMGDLYVSIPEYRRGKKAKPSRFLKKFKI